MVKSKATAALAEVKGLLEQDKDFLKELVQEIVQQTLEAEMDVALGAVKGERSEARLGIAAGTTEGL